jgi:hypothetical protein
MAGGSINLWFPKDEHQRVWWSSTAVLSLDYFNILMKHAVPLDERAYFALSPRDGYLCLADTTASPDSAANTISCDLGSKVIGSAIPDPPTDGGIRLRGYGVRVLIAFVVWCGSAAYAQPIRVTKPTITSKSFHPVQNRSCGALSGLLIADNSAHILWLNFVSFPAFLGSKEVENSLRTRS